MSYKDPDLVSSRLLTAALGNLGSGADDEDITGYTKSNEFVLCVQLDEASGPWNNVTYRLRWRNVTDAGSFAQLTGSGELVYGTNTSLTNAGTYSTKRCNNTPSGSTWDQGREVEGSSDSPSISVADEHYFEICYAINAANAHDGDQYEFEVYDQTNTASVGTAAAQITMLGLVDYPVYPDVGGLTMAGVAPTIAATDHRAVIAQAGAALMLAFSPKMNLGITPMCEVNIVDAFVDSGGFIWEDDDGFVWRDE